MHYLSRHRKAHLLDHVIARLGIRTDRELAVRLRMSPSAISKARSGCSVSPGMLLALHDLTGLSIAELRKLHYSELSDIGKSH